MRDEGFLENTRNISSCFAFLPKSTSLMYLLFWAIFKSRTHFYNFCRSAVGAQLRRGRSAGRSATPDCQPERNPERNSENSAGARPERNSDFCRSANALGFVFIKACVSQKVVQKCVNYVTLRILRERKYKVAKVVWAAWTFTLKINWNILPELKLDWQQYQPFHQMV